MTLAKLLTDFVQSFDEEYTITLSDEFNSSVSEMTVFYTCEDTEDEMGKAFRADFIKRFPECADFSLFTLSFFHELGHLETEWDMVDDTEKRNNIKSAKQYFRLHNERIATNWAGEYLTENHDEMKKFEKKILKIIGKKA